MYPAARTIERGVTIWLGVVALEGAGISVDAMPMMVAVLAQVLTKCALSSECNLTAMFNRFVLEGMIRFGGIFIGGWNAAQSGRKKITQHNPLLLLCEGGISCHGADGSYSGGTEVFARCKLRHLSKSLDVGFHIFTTTWMTSRKPEADSATDATKRKKITCVGISAVPLKLVGCNRQQ